ncbi:MAG: DegT/DnrJ/EryC1/StrS family aminotransferase [Lentisphaerae bacterium]|jgi:dTDP-4-amino-4,6-dideoxygalactose transaminase|nr:DegT/DnrJ/EryC1/StrS family aminotransferase [Lentisphaerota bacterium]MBT4821064.1 DegT/DnrJ/EryC1/StrS family aminotransferase [Lentisphaerota bacterium]MBT5610417.1 DegT/DnrJ/EryC1/StrS family aminotransferase [Lentisphaerota bacterium]MBT7061671.1 DegT/DnrJ/EryC1/StrS family aminotransferase [Lentisphaerota bacterium]
MANLAKNGGNKTITRPLGPTWPIWDEREEKALIETLHSGIWWRGGRKDVSESQVGQFEDEFGAFQGAKYCVAVTNGTQAIECALKALGIGPGDDVLVPALTFVASATAIALVGATPVFVDVDPGTYNIDAGAMEAAITPATKAAVVVHNGGYPVDMDRVMDLAERRGLKIVEDCAHAHGTQWRGKGAGSIGHFGTFSFQMGKTLTCGEGGAVLTNDEDLAQRAFAHQHIGPIPGRPFPETRRLGSNLRMTEWQGAILRTQFQRLTELTENRERNATYLAAGLKDIPGLDPIDRDPRVTRWGFYFWNFHYRQEEFDGVPRSTFIQAAAAEGVPVGAGAHGGCIYKNPVFQNADGVMPAYTKVVCPVAERVGDSQALSITHKAFLGTTDAMDMILAAFRKIRENTDELK